MSIYVNCLIYAPSCLVYSHTPMFVLIQCNSIMVTLQLEFHNSFTMRSVLSSRCISRVFDVAESAKCKYPKMANYIYWVD